MAARFLARSHRPSPRAIVLVLSTAIVLATTAAVAVNVSDNLRQVAVDEATRTTDALLRGYLGTTLLPQALADPSGAVATEVNHRLEELTASGDVLRIKVWAKDARVVFSDLPALRGRQ